ncbi:TasA family protein [Halorubrum sp. CBA1125]|uniref:TasA family protein n=1 Tax=Halorubrum sp. CBA1125 TaxID=2668072 RepID=UPI0018D247BE|nr:TasA family protein [Halorubrum sp. CBA1125]
MSNNNTMSRRKLLGGVALVGAASAGAGAGTYAYISDDGEAAFSFQAGSIILKINPETVGFTSSSDTSGDQDDGDEMIEEIALSNHGTLDANVLQLSNLGLSGPQDLRAGATVTTFEFTAPDETTFDLPTDQSLAELESSVNNSPLSLDNGEMEPVLEPMGDVGTLRIGITYDYEVVTTNGGMLEVDFGFTASQ